MALRKISTFDDWIDNFRQWKADIGLRLPKAFDEFPFEAKFGDLKSEEIEYGDFAGGRKWDRLTQIPHQPIRDALLNLIVYQGDTEFASVEQQRHLLETAPSTYDLESACRIMVEEMRHGWQMCNLLVTHFGETGKIEARKLLERRAWDNNRLLGSFNVNVDHWVDFFTYTEFVDRDGKFQLNMLSTSAFAPLARSMGPMLKEEAFHLGTGHMGLQRILQRGVVPLPIVQRYVNKWVPTAYDLFGTDHSSSAQWLYVWGLKGRYDEAKQAGEADKEHLNETSRGAFYDEVQQLIGQLNRHVPEGQPKLVAPDLKFHRAIGDFKEGRYSIEGRELSPEAYAAHLAEVLPTPADQEALRDIFTSGETWIEPRGKGSAAS
ncbi:MAG TPA: Phenylacetic acid catabolic protein [Thermoanaerobaculia bacterium]|nr:Phenylacetic acid catabolic protein [Thermoanaerobaculia bacterium]